MLTVVIIVIAGAIIIMIRHSADKRADSARTFYVSSNGDDNSDGLAKNRPWKTLNRVSAERLLPGDRILLMGGANFHGTLALDAQDAGDAQNPVIIDSYGPWRPSIESDLGVNITNTAGVTIRNLGIYGAGERAQAGILVLNDLQDARRLEGITLENLDVSGFANGINIGAAEGAMGFSHVRISDTAVRNNKKNGLAISGPTFDISNPIYAHSDVVITGVDAYDNTGDPETPESNSGSGIVIGSVDNGRIEECAAFRNGVSAASPREGPVGIWAYDSIRIVIERNVSFSNRSQGADGDGFGLDQNTSDSIIQYNLSYGNDGAGILLYGQRSSGPNMRNVVRYNISVNDVRRSGGTLGAISLLGGIDNGAYNGHVSEAKVYQNTVVLNDANPVKPALLLMGRLQSAIVANNVLAGPLALAGRQTSGDSVLQGNNYFSLRPSLLEWDGVEFATFDDWRNRPGAQSSDKVPGGIVAAPDLVDWAVPAGIISPTQLDAATGFAPKPGSPLIGSGVPLHSVGITEPGGRDFLGTEVDSDRRDIGAVAG